MSISTLFSIDGDVVFYSPSISDRRHELWNRLLSGDAKAVNIWGFAMSPLESSVAFETICNRRIGPTLADKILANIYMYPILTSLIRSELDELPIELGGQVLEKLSSVLTALAAGMFTFANSQLTTLPADEFLTAERIKRYSTMIHSCNACP
jgi:hypothetical protein